MFGLSPSKLLFTVAIIAAVWYGFKWLNRLQERQEKAPRNDRKDSAAPQSRRETVQEADYEDLVACPKCGDYVLAGKKCGCGKEGCPNDK
ncbi:hypothetical protein [Terasakiella pusilla]|uniref:hypothetical protein n=1 Tax=Terasakiella pusilla TaxID=64973 RepID=UPI003AA7FC61